MKRSPSDPNLGLRARTAEPLLWLDGAGHETRGDAGYRHDARKRPDSQVTLQLTLAGEGFHANRQTRNVLTRGKAWIDHIPGSFEYGFNPDSPRPYELVYVSLSGPVARRWYRRIVAQFGHILDFGVDGAVQAQMLTLAHAREAGALPDRYLLSGQLYQLLMTIFSALRSSRVSTSPRIAQAIDLISQHGSDPCFNIDELARRLDCSREYLSRQFRATTGVSPGDYLHQHRLRSAARALREGNEKLQIIARRHGFSGANYFCRAFRKRYGVTPAQFRAQPWMVVT